MRLKLSTALLLGLLVVALVSVREARSVPSSPALATIADQLNPGGTKDYSYNIKKDLDEYLLHVRLDVKAPETDTLDITIDHSIIDRWTDLQGDFWDSWGPLTAGNHILTATTNPNASSQVKFVVEFYEIPAPPFTVEGRFPAKPYNNICRIHVMLPQAGPYAISANANEGNFTLLPTGHDAIGVTGPTKRTLQFDEAGVWEFQVQVPGADSPGRGAATAWSITIASATSKPSLNVKIVEGCEKVGPGLSCIFSADGSASDGSHPDIRYNWTTTGGCFVTEPSKCLPTIIGQSANWTAPASSSEITYRVTVEATASGYESGMDSWPVVVPEFPPGSLALVILVVLTATFLLARKHRLRQ